MNPRSVSSDLVLDTQPLPELLLEQPADTSRRRLKVTLLAVLPADGTRRTIEQLAQQTAASHSAVMDALHDEWYAGRVGYDHEQRAFYMDKTPDAAKGVA